MRAHWLRPAVERSHSDTCVGCIVRDTTPHQLRVETVQVNLLAQRRAEALDSVLRLVPGAVETAIDDVLYLTAQRLEQGSYRQGRANDGQVTARGDGTQGLLEKKHARPVHECQPGVQRTVDH